MIRVAFFHAGIRQVWVVRRIPHPQSWVLSMDTVFEDDVTAVDVMGLT